MAIKRTAEDSDGNESRSQTVQVPTKLNDGGGQNEKSQAYKACNKEIRVSEIKKEEDPFLFFSIQSNVSSVLLGDGDNTNRPDGKMMMADAERVVVPSKVRKTKISCEAHPHLFFESLFRIEVDD
mmetsp:Transcript_22222/g.46239  ORF Transcript_22222/g.46239 Transcript_22222/m.46239 type:complete len:125 (+) Transcript_22222:221-595(+)